MEPEFALVRDQNCFLYNKPQGGIEDEIISGWTVRVFPGTEKDGWVKIETFYGYEGYVRQGQLAFLREEELLRRQDHGRFLRVRLTSADLLSEERVQGQIVETLLKNSLVELLSEKDGWCRVKSAAGNEGFLHAAALCGRKDDDAYLLEAKGRKAWFEERVRKNPPGEASFREGLVKSARAYLGAQYRWGGKSPLGLDCSGLVFLSYMENGVLIYRDASMPEEYPMREIGRAALKPGDLIYFPGHVAMYLGDERFIHATGYLKTPYVTISSLDPADPDYRPDLADSVTAYGSIFAK